MKRKINTILFLTLAKLMLFALFFLLLFSCRKNSDSTNSDGQALVQVKIENSFFEDVATIDKRGAANKVTVKDKQIATLAWDRNFMLNVELSAASPLRPVATQATVASGKRAAIETSDLGPNIRYSVAIFDDAGRYLTLRNYQYGQESLAEPLMLDGGRQYTFIAYSVNSTLESDMPTITFSDPNNRILSNSSISVTNNADIMYYRRDMTVSGSQVNYLNVTLKHLLSQITTTIDASATGYHVTAISSQFSPHYSTAIVNLANAAISRPGTAVTSAVTFQSLNAASVTSVPTRINSSLNNNTSYSISTLTIGPLTQANITALSDLNVTPGVKYNLRLTLVPRDAYLTHVGQPAVRINGSVWMRHNLGANTSVNPDQTPITSALHGNYYQWGRITSVGNGTSTTVSNWDGNNNPPANAWNSGTETAPIKTTNDPCPVGYRVPTKAEMDKLLLDVVATTVGSRVESPANYSGAAVLTSKRNVAIKMTIPAQGGYPVSGNGYPYTALPIAARGLTAFLANSYIIGTRISQLVGSSDGNVVIRIRAGENAAYKTIAYPIRCIAQ